MFTFYSRPVYIIISKCSALHLCTRVMRIQSPRCTMITQESYTCDSKCNNCSVVPGCAMQCLVFLPEHVADEARRAQPPMPLLICIFFISYIIAFVISQHISTLPLAHLLVGLSFLLYELPCSGEVR